MQINNKKIIHFPESNSENIYFHMYVKKLQMAQYNVTAKDSAEVLPSCIAAEAISDLTGI